MVPYLTACLITMVTLAISFKASAEQRLVDVMFAQRIVPKAHVGNWKVVVSTVGEAGEVICVAHFVVR